MIDNTNPTSQFHPYQPQDAIPVSERQQPGVLSGVLSRLGIDPSKVGSSLNSVNLSKVRTMARNNGGLVLGGLAALAIGAGLLRGRR
jgi:hypothetical protein